MIQYNKRLNEIEREQDFRELKEKSRREELDKRLYILKTNNYKVFNLEIQPKGH